MMKISGNATPNEFRCFMKHLLILIIALLGGSAGHATAATNFVSGSINTAGNWDNGLPNQGNVGTIAANGTNASTVFGYGAGSITNLTAGTLTSGDGFNITSGTWNVSGGKVITRYFLSNGSNTVINLSGGSVELGNVAGTRHMGTANGGTLKISGSVVLDGTRATTGVQTGGTIDFSSEWTGSWTWGTYSGDDWRAWFTSNPDVKVDGVNIDATSFNSTFLVSNSGKTLELVVDNTVARNPSPANGALNISAPSSLAWSPPTDYTASGYKIYFGTDPEVRDNPMSTVSTNTWNPPGKLAWSTTCYWVVDSMDGATTHSGTAWNFTTEPDPSALYDPLVDLKQYNVVWNSPGSNSAGSMPIGNGDLGMNVWVEANGDLLLLLGKTDAWSDNGRLLKLGRVRIHMTPNPFTSGQPFLQTLNLPNGEILVSAGPPGDEVSFRIWVDANHPAIHVEALGDKPRDWQADVEIWRNSQRAFVNADELNSAYGVRSAPTAPLIEPDTVVAGLTDKVTWYHRNIRSPWPETLAVQGLGHLAGIMTDPILNRTFGATLDADGFSNATNTRLISDAPRHDAHFTIVALTSVTGTAADWQTALDGQVAQVEAESLTECKTKHSGWWQAFWKRHWLVVTETGGGIVPGSDAYRVTQGYLLQRFINACAGRGGAPIQFNGSIFTVDATSAYDPDYRKWGPCYWWQNTRLPYWSMPMAGDLDLMEPLFRMYRDALPLARERVQTYYGHAGAYFPETMYFWGTWNNDNYGWNRTGKTDGVSDNQFIRWEWQSGIELLWMMLARYNVEPDADFANATLVPMARDIIDLYDLRYPRDPDGEIRFTPAQALETYWEGTQNPTPEVAGLKQVLGDLLKLPATLTTALQRDRWTRVLSELPPLPMRNMNGQPAISPAAIIGPKNNAESPELYPVFPYGLYHVGKPDLALADWTYQTRVNKTSNGWSQDVIFAAMLGRTAEARSEVIRRFKTKNSGSRFPAFWGPNYDWIPDQDHGAVNMIALQKMILQEDGDRILLFPSWPADWDLKFRFHAKGATLVEGELKDGEIIEFNINPPERRGDVETFVGTLPPPLTGWENWRRNTPGAGGAPTDNEDHDPFVDLLEYALGGNPADPTTPRGLSLLPDVSGMGFTLSYTRPTGLPDVFYTTEENSNLDPIGWHSLTATPRVNDNNDGSETVFHEIPTPVSKASFFRLKAALPH